MANSYFGVNDLITLNDRNAKDYGISNLLNKATVLSELSATPASDGTLHKYIVQTGAPNPQFRLVNVGKPNSNSVYTEYVAQLALMDGTFVVDIALANSYQFGAEKFLQKESAAQLRQAFFNIETQMWYGTTALGNAMGFTGFAQQTAMLTSTSPLCVNAGGTVANTASSVFILRSPEDLTGVAVVLGNSGNITIDPTVVTYKPDDTIPTNFLPAYMTPITGYSGVQTGGYYSAVRICNLTNESGHGLTDKLISSAISLMPADLQNDLIVCMDRRSLMQLQQSRTATNPTGQAAPFPTESYTYPIVVTDSIVNVEPII